MPKDAKGKALAETKRAQLDCERNVKAAREARRKAFEQARPDDRVFLDGARTIVF